MIANIYQPSQGICAHIDLLRFDDGIAILSLESDCVMHFTGHQDGKIKVWKVSFKNPSKHKRIGSLPTFKDYMKCSMNPKNYVQVRRNRNAVMVGEMKVVVGVNQRGLEIGAPRRLIEGAERQPSSAMFTKTLCMKWLKISKRMELLRLIGEI
ncbi:hypothetical protein VIGAN_11178200 [Vigna angularis var. angularis]|uniref:Uncharacterized protein n=1 Tax=Vigna angularis var. angularis TaxID=157739 RepID=A0A0S3TB62_PHAAN|nr:hypothetical protein VIGAN_11178200 [Vigna angularis var. angularis]